MLARFDKTVYDFASTYCYFRSSWLLSHCLQMLLTPSFDMIKYHCVHLYCSLHTAMKELRSTPCVRQAYRLHTPTNQLTEYLLCVWQACSLHTPIKQLREYSFCVWQACSLHTPPKQLRECTFCVRQACRMHTPTKQLREYPFCVRQACSLHTPTKQLREYLSVWGRHAGCTLWPNN